MYGDDEILKLEDRICDLELKRLAPIRQKHSAANANKLAMLRGLEQGRPKPGSEAYSALLRLRAELGM